MKAITTMVLVALLHATTAFADCGAISEQLFGVRLGGPRTYLNQVPTGLSMSQAKQDWKFGGMDVLTGTSQEIDFLQASFFWHEGQVVLVQAIARGPTKEALDGVLVKVSKLAAAEFRYEQRGDNFHMQCNDRLRVMAAKGQGAGGASTPPVQILVLTIEHPLRAEMEKAIREQAIQKEQAQRDVAKKAR